MASDVNLYVPPAVGERTRDAIHCPLFSAVLKESVKPGAHVGLVNWPESTEVSVFAEEKVGIVNPFLEKIPEAGEPVWVLLYPNTIQALRHVWAHPAFKSKVVTPKQVAEQFNPAGAS